jgi:hypothetical protein
MTKKQVIFWRFNLILIMIFGIYFITLNFLGDKKQNIYQIIRKIKTNYKMTPVKNRGRYD